MKYRLLIAYDGSDYAGWQRQDNALAVQQVVEEAVAAIAGQEVTVHGAGRTDAGVHAAGQAAHLDLPAGNLPSGETRRALIHGVNHHLPAAIRVLSADPVDDSFHARKSASFKVYGYRLCTAPVIDPFRAPFVVPAPRRLDLESMKAAASLIRGRHDFAAFAKAGGGHGSTVRTIHEARWTEQGDEIRFRVAGDGFLRGMVRALVGTTLEVGLGRRSPDDLAALLGGRPRAEAGPNAPARGLCLERVEYDHAK
ncbi:MAG: tRNA pseudouridine(38-40) synthase TruA [Holophagales bacterium]|nr:tRNA pseudouridine(38-40) synthase TruA [Holophagales bacterium]MYF05779.1 tRNA pseudouridine(38-40) synthase TruA [Holophagales bacterium]MYJ24457.1 tRNA pseudouridine(38-40) synthase TruA [Holophagales bacterium]